MLARIGGSLRASVSTWANPEVYFTDHDKLVWHFTNNLLTVNFKKS